MNADVGQGACDLELLLRRVTDARHLFAVAQRFVVDTNLRGIGETDVPRKLFRVADQSLDRLAKLHALTFVFGHRTPWKAARLDRGRLLALGEAAVRGRARTGAPGVNTQLGNVGRENHVERPVERNA